MSKITSKFPPQKKPRLENSENNVTTAKTCLHTSSPLQLIARESQLAEISSFLSTNIKNKTSGAMYICGAPGTGKTAVVENAVNSEQCFKVFVNCMGVKGLKDVYEAVGKVVGNFTQDKLVFKRKIGKMIVLILDEVDQLPPSSLSSIFKQTSLKNSRLIAIGIANKLDLADFESPKVKTINFPPYEREEIEQILESRLSQSNIFEPSAIKFVAAKVAATTGDMRKALNACAVALEKVERGEREVLREGFAFSSPQKRQISKLISVAAVAKVFAPPKDDGPLPLQQMAVLATFVKIYRSGKSKSDGVKAPIPMTTFYEEYRKFCGTAGLPWIERSDMLGVCVLLQDRGLVGVREEGKKKGGTLRGANNCLLSFQLGAVEGVVGGYFGL